MRRFIPLLAVVASGFIYSTSTFAQVTAASDPVGFTTTSLLGASDTLISVPFTRPPEFTGAIQSVSVGTPTGTITAAGTPGWTANQFAYVAVSQPKHYYALIGGGGSSNPKEGRFYPITANGTNTLTVTTTTASDLSGITANTQVVIVPYWTPATVFPPTDANVSFTPTSSAPTYKTQILIANDSGPSITYSPIYYFDGSTSKWRIEGVGDPDRGDDQLSPDSFFVIRNDNGATTLPLTALGSVLMKKFSAPLMTSVSGTYDNAVSMRRPIDVPLNATGLNGLFVATDQLLLFDNTQAAINKTPSATYTWDPSVVGPSGGWRLTGDGANDHGSDIILAGNAMIVRKAQTGGGATAFWTNAFPVKALTAGSRKVHNGNPFDMPLSLSLRWDSVPGVECRVAGSTPAGAGVVDHQIVLTFPSIVSFTSVIPTSGAAAVDSSSGSGTSTVTVNLKTVTNAQKVTVTLVGVNDLTNTNDVAVELGVLLGDVNGDGFVLSGDYTAIRQKSGAALDGTTFKFDLNADGFILSGDYTTARQQSGAHL